MSLRRTARHLRHGMVLTTVTALAVTGLAAPGWAQQQPAPPQPTTAGPEKQARDTGQRVEITALTTETTKVFANPSGTHTTEIDQVPVRVRRGTGWVPVDTTLKPGPDGTLAPEATPIPVRFSGGGTAPMLRFGKPGQEVELRWPTALPAPKLAGPTATYPDVLPGVDLVLRATPQGYGQRLLVKTPQAAANPALDEIRFGTKTTGLSLRRNDNNTTEAVDASGKVVYAAAPPSVSETKEVPRAAPGAVTLGRDELTVLTDRSLFTSKDAAYPMAIDPPTWDPPRHGWTQVYVAPAAYNNTNYWNGRNDSPNEAKVGLSYDYAVTVRSYFQFNLDPGLLGGAEIRSAEFNVRQMYTPSCTAKRTVELHRTDPVGDWTTYNNRPAELGFLGSHNVSMGRPECPAGYLGFQVADAVRGGLSNGTNLATVMLRTNEGDNLAWRKYDPNSAKMVVEYNHRPDTPVDLTATTPLNPSLPCSEAPDVVATNSTTPTLNARVTDRNGGPVNAFFEWYDYQGIGRGSGWGQSQNSGSVMSVTVPQDHYSDGRKIAWRVRGHDYLAADSDWSRWCVITVDQQPPGVPKVSSDVYVGFDPSSSDGTISGAAGQTGSFFFDANGNADVEGFWYRTSDIDAPQFIGTDKPGGKAWVPVTPSREGSYDVWVSSQDKAKNVGTEQNYHFFVGRGTPPVAHWTMDGATTATVAYELTGQRNATVGGPAGSTGWTTGRIDDALQINNNGYATAAGQPLSTVNAFALSAWVKADVVDGNSRTAISQDGSKMSGYTLGYAGDTKSFAFTMPKADADGAVDRVTAPTPAVPGAWTHLLGVYDAGSKQMKLYVNGELSGTVAHDTPWDAKGAIQFGRGKRGGSYVDGWRGAIDDVKVFNRIPSDVMKTEGNRQILSEVHALASTPTVTEGSWTFDEGRGTVAEDVSASNRPGTLNAGVSWAAGRVGPFAARFDGKTGVIDTGGPAVRTNGMFTIAAMVKATDLTGTRTVISQDATAQDGYAGSGFALAAQNGKWTFTVPDAATATDPSPARAGEWVALAGVYDTISKQARLYVNGALVSAVNIPANATRRNATGNLVLGRGRASSAPTQYWHGDIDQVRVYTGVRSDDQVKEETRPIPGPSSYFSLQLTRWTGHNGDNYTSNGPAPAGYRPTMALGLPAPDGAPNTHVLYKCQVGGANEMTSADERCEGTKVLGRLGTVYSTPPADVPTRPLYRCNDTGRDHFDSLDANCEGHGVKEGTLGHVVAGAMLRRYASKNIPWDHLTTIGEAPANYRFEGALGFVTLPGVSGADRTMLGCRNGQDYFTTTDSTCGTGATQVESMGGMWSADPGKGDGRARAVFRCRVDGGSQEYFDSIDPNCDGQKVDRQHGYVASNFPLPASTPES